MSFGSKIEAFGSTGLFRINPQTHLRNVGFEKGCGKVKAVVYAIFAALACLTIVAPLLLGCCVLIGRCVAKKEKAALVKKVDQQLENSKNPMVALLKGAMLKEKPQVSKTLQLFVVKESELGKDNFCYITFHVFSAYNILVKHDQETDALSVAAVSYADPEFKEIKCKDSWTLVEFAKQAFTQAWKDKIESNVFNLIYDNINDG